MRWRAGARVSLFAGWGHIWGQLLGSPCSVGGGEGLAIYTWAGQPVTVGFQSSKRLSESGEPFRGMGHNWIL